MNKKAVLLTALAILVIGGIGAGGYYFYKNKVSADVAGNGATITKPDYGLEIKVVASDGKTLLGGARVGVLAADINNTAVRSKLSVSAGDRGATADAMDKLTGNNDKQNVLTDTGAKMLSSINEVSSLYMVKNQEGSYNIPNASDPNHGVHGMYWYDENVFSLKDSAGKVFKSYTPIRIYVEYGGQIIVKDLLQTGKTGANAAEYLYKNSVMNSYTMVVPVDVKNLSDYESGVVFKAMDLNNNAISNVSFNVALVASYSRPWSRRDRWTNNGVSGINVTTDKNGVAKIDSKMIEDKYDAVYGQAGKPETWNVDFSQDIHLYYGCILNDNVQCGTNAAWAGNWARNYLDEIYITSQVGRKTLPSVARVVHLNTNADTNALSVKFSLDGNKKTYKAGDTVKAIVDFGSASETGKSMTITRTTQDPIQLNLSNTLDYSVSYPAAQTSVAQYVDKKASGDQYVYSLTLPSDIKPGTYKLTGNIINVTRALDPIYIEVVAATPAS